MVASVSCLIVLPISCEQFLTRIGCRTSCASRACTISLNPETWHHANDGRGCNETLPTNALTKHASLPGIGKTAFDSLLVRKKGNLKSLNKLVFACFRFPVKSLEEIGSLRISRASGFVFLFAEAMAGGFHP